MLKLLRLTRVFMGKKRLPFIVIIILMIISTVVTAYYLSILNHSVLTTRWVNESGIEHMLVASSPIDVPSSGVRSLSYEGEIKAHGVVDVMYGVHPDLTNNPSNPIIASKYILFDKTANDYFPIKSNPSIEEVLEMPVPEGEIHAIIPYNSAHEVGEVIPIQFREEMLSVRMVARQTKDNLQLDYVTYAPYEYSNLVDDQQAMIFVADEQGLCIDQERYWHSLLPTKFMVLPEDFSQEELRGLVRFLQSEGEGGFATMSDIRAQSERASSNLLHRHYLYPLVLFVIVSMMIINFSVLRTEHLRKRVVILRFLGASRFETVLAFSMLTIGAAIFASIIAALLILLVDWSRPALFFARTRTLITPQSIFQATLPVVFISMIASAVTAQLLPKGEVAEALGRSE